MATTNGISKDLAEKIATPGGQLTRNEFKTTVKSFESEIAEALPVHLKKNAEKYARQALTLFSQNPKLQQCTGVTILSALMTASALGLDLTPQLGQCYIIPYDNRKKSGNKWVTVTEAQFQLGYRGVIALAQRSGEVTRIQAEVVREKDYFKYSKGLHPILEHEESVEEDRGEITHVYAVANFKNGGYSFEAWSVAQVIAHAKKFSKSYYKDEYKNDIKTGNRIINDKSPWHTNFESMAKKTLIMAIWKYLPISTELMLAAATDGTIKNGVSHLREEKDIITVSPTPVNDDAENGEMRELPDRTETARRETIQAAARIDPEMTSLGSATQPETPQQETLHLMSELEKPREYPPL